MNDQETYLKELNEDMQVEKKLWKKEILVFSVLTALVVVREVYLNEWFNFGV